MKTEKVSSGNVGENVYATRATHQRWDAYWWFHVPEGMTGMGFVARLNQNSPVEATLALFPPGTDTETTQITDGRVQSQHFYPNSDPVKIGFHFNQSGKHIFAFAGSPHQATDVFNKVMKEINEGKRPGAFLNLEIYELTFADNLPQDSSQMSQQIISSIEQERLRPGMPTNSQPHSPQTTPSAGDQPPPAPQSGDRYSPAQGQQPANYHTHVYVNEFGTGKQRKKRGIWFYLLAGIVILICCCILFFIWGMGSAEGYW